MTHTPRQTLALPVPALRMGALLLTGAMALVPFATYGQTATAPLDDPAQAAAPDAKPDTADAAAPEGKPEGQAGMQSATADISNADGGNLGRATVADTASGALHVTLDLQNAAPGPHAVHIHETGKCDAPDFESAGGHLAAEKAHGIKDPDGMHPGDLPNVMVGGDGVLKAEFFTSNLTMAQMMDDDGSAFVMHEGTDDYTSQPSGDAGGRVACGVFSAAPG